MILKAVSSLPFVLFGTPQANAEEELPEELLGTMRVSHLEPNAALDLDLDHSSRSVQGA